MNIGTVVEQLDAYTCRECCRKTLILQLATSDSMSLVADKKAQGILSFTNLTHQVGLLSQHSIVVALGSLNGSSAITKLGILQHLHGLPGILGQSFHIVNQFHLLIEHQQGIIHVGDVGDKVGLYRYLIILQLKKSHLSTALLREQISEEVNRPAGSNRQAVSLGSSVTIPGSDGSLRSERQGRHECQLSAFQLLFCHLHVQSRIEEVDIVIQSFLDERLKLRIGKDTAPRDIGEGSSILYSQSICIRSYIANDTAGLHIRTLILSVESLAAAQGERCETQYDDI